MTLSEVIASLIIFMLFLSGISRVIKPSIELSEQAEINRRFANSVNFAGETFRRTCADPDGSIEKWQSDILSAAGVDSCSVTEAGKTDQSIFFEADCSVYGETIKILGERKL